MEAVLGGDAEENAKILCSIFEGKERGPRRDIVLLNAGAALYAANKVSSIREGVEAASASIDSGSARAALNHLVEVTNSFANQPETVTPEEEMYPPRFLWDVD